MEPNSRRIGFSLVELLVVIGIISALISLFLPAIQAARESARKVQCKNNLHQIGIALHVYHDVHRSLPTGCIQWRGFRASKSRRQFAWSALLLPFVEQTALHANIDFAQPFDAPENASAAAMRVAMYECASAEQRSMIRAQTDYGGLSGELILDRDQQDGSLINETSIRFADISDGLCNTLIVSEDVGGPDSEWINGRNIFVQNHGINDPVAWPGDNEIRSKHFGGAMVLFADGRTRFLPNSLNLNTLGQIITRSSNEIIDGEEVF